MRTTIAQMLSVLVIIAAVVSMGVGLTNSETVWNSAVLPYTVPDLPLFYQDNGRDRPTFCLGTFSPTSSFKDGETMFRHYHRFGWEYCRKQFVSAGMYRDCPYQSIDIQLSKQEWTFEHMQFALAEGYLQCSEQIDDLVEIHGLKIARGRIGYSNLWYVIPPVIAATCGVLMLDFTCKRNG